MENDPYEKLKKRIRATGYCVIPFRLGIAVAESGEELPNPYQKRGRSSFDQGVAWARSGHGLSPAFPPLPDEEAQDSEPSP